MATEDNGAYRSVNLIASHNIAAEQELPILPVIFNNQHYYRVLRLTVGLTPGGYASRSNRAPITFPDGVSKYEKAIRLRRRQELVNVMCS